MNHSPDHLAAMSLRYCSVYHIAPLPSGNLAIFGPKFDLITITSPEGAIPYLLSPPPIYREPPRQTFRASEDLLSSLGLL